MAPCLSTAQTPYTPPAVSEYQLLEHLIQTNPTASSIAVKLAASPVGKDGYVGVNSPTNKGSIYPDFLAEDQRGAFTNMLEGVLKDDDANLYKGWQALTITYDHQQPAGDFAPPKSHCHTTACMRFFMAASNHALSVLLESPSAAKRPPGSKLTYAELIHGTGNGDYGLLPKIKAAMDYMVSHATHDKKDPLYTDFSCPNRALTDAEAFAFGYLLLLHYPPAAGSLAGYEAEAKWWIDDVFVRSQDERFSDRPMANLKTGIFYEGNKFNGFGYDSNYSAVGLSHLMSYAYNFPQHLTSAGVDPKEFLKLSGRFLEQRIHLVDPTGQVRGPVVDTTNDTRTGPIPNPEQGKEMDFDLPEARFAMFFYTALYNRPEGVVTISSTQPYTTVFGRPPVIFNDPDTLQLNLRRGKPMSSYTVYSTNAGIQAGDTQTLDPAFKVTAEGLPKGLTLGAVHSYPPSLHLDAGLGMADITGTPQQAGTYTVSLRAANQYGDGKKIALVIVVR